MEIKKAAHHYTYRWFDPDKREWFTACVCRDANCEKVKK